MRIMDSDGNECSVEDKEALDSTFGGDPEGHKVFAATVSTLTPPEAVRLWKMTAVMGPQWGAEDAIRAFPGLAYKYPRSAKGNLELQEILDIMRSRPPAVKSVKDAISVGKQALLGTDIPIRCSDLSCGLGTLSYAAASLGLKLVWAQESDENARAIYEANFGIKPCKSLPDYLEDGFDADILFAPVPESLEEFNKGVARVAETFRPAGVILGSGFANIPEAGPGGEDDPLSYLGFFWSCFGSNMVRLGYRRVGRITIGAGAYDQLDPYQYRLYVANLLGTRFPIEEIEARTTDVLDDAEVVWAQLLAEKFGYSGRKYMGGKRLWVALEDMPEHFVTGAIWDEDSLRDWRWPTESPNFDVMAYKTLSLPLAEAAVSVMVDLLKGKTWDRRR